MTAVKAIPRPTTIQKLASVNEQVWLKLGNLLHKEKKKKREREKESERERKRRGFKYILWEYRLGGV